MKLFKYSFFAIFSFGFLFCGCTSEKEEMAKHHFDNKAYINFTNKIEEKIVKADTGAEYDRTLSFSTALTVDEKVTGTFCVNPSKLDEFKENYNPEAELFPVENVQIENAETFIESGSNLSTEATVKFLKVNELDKKLVYVLPVSLQNVTGVELLDSKNTVYYLFKGGALINVAVNMEKNRAGAKSWGNPSVFEDMQEFTIEFLVHPNKFGRLISTVLGVEGHFLLRFGDAGVPDNQLQIAAGSNHTNADLAATVGEWSHYTIVFNHGNIKVYKDGSLKLDEDDRRSAVTFMPYGNDVAEVNGRRYFWLGYSYEPDRYFDGEMSEVRIWKKCLTKEEINATSHFYFADASDPALAAYWKCDDAAGLTLKDYSSNGNDLTLDAECKWPNVSLPENK